MIIYKNYLIFFNLENDFLVIKLMYPLRELYFLFDRGNPSNIVMFINSINKEDNQKEIILQFDDYNSATKVCKKLKFSKINSILVNLLYYINILLI